MKKWLCLVLVGVLLLSLAGCDGEPASSVDTSSDTSTTTSTTTATTQTPPSVAPYSPKAEGLLVLKPEGTSQIESGNIGIPDATGVPHNDATAADLTSFEAQAILEVLIPRQFEVFSLFQLQHEKVDYTQNTPFSKWYSPYSDERFTCVQDIRDFVARVYTGEEAKWYFNVYLDAEGVPEESETYPYYRDYNGKLYRCTYAEGKGLNYSYYLTDTAYVVERTENMVLVRMYGDRLSDEDDEKDTIYIFLLCKTPDGWRLDSEFLQEVFL